MLNLSISRPLSQRFWYLFGRIPLRGRHPTGSALASVLRTRLLRRRPSGRLARGRHGHHKILCIRTPPQRLYELHQQPHAVAGGGFAFGVGRITEGYARYI